MKLWMVLGVLIAALSLCDATFFLTKHIFKKDTPESPKERPHGVWKKKMVWKPRWIKEWKEAKVWKPVWKKVWDPVWIQEWVTIAKPHPKKNGADDVDLTASQPSPGLYGQQNSQPGPVYLTPDSGDIYKYADQSQGNSYIPPDFGQSNNGNNGYLPPDPIQPGPVPGNTYGPPDFGKPHQGTIYVAPEYSAPPASTPQGQFSPGGSYLPPGNPPATPGDTYGPPAPPGNGYLPPPPDGNNRKSDDSKAEEFRPSQPLPDLSGFQPVAVIS